MRVIHFSPDVYISCFFFSSRRRHTRSDRDWSSDVCSSDLGPDLLGVPRPWRERLFHGQLPLDCAAEWRLADALRLCARGDERQTGEEPAATLAHAAHLAPRSRSAGSLGGLPRSQKTSRSIVSS